MKELATYSIVLPWDVIVHQGVNGQVVLMDFNVGRLVC